SVTGDRTTTSRVDLRRGQRAAFSPAPWSRSPSFSRADARAAAKPDVVRWQILERRVLDPLRGATPVCRDHAERPGAPRRRRTGHVCAPPGGGLRGPLITSAVFDPPAAGTGLVTLVLEADEGIAADPPPSVALVAPLTDPGFEVSRADGEPHAELVLDVSD